METEFQLRRLLAGIFLTFACLCANASGTPVLALIFLGAQMLLALVVGILLALSNVGYLASLVVGNSLLLFIYTAMTGSPLFAFLGCLPASLIVISCVAIGKNIRPSTKQEPSPLPWPNDASNLNFEAVGSLPSISEAELERQSFTTSKDGEPGGKSA